MRRKRKSIFDEFFGESLFDEWDEIFKKFENLSIPSGYSITITQTGDKTEIHVKAGEDVDVDELKRELELKYPGAKIYIEGGRKSRMIEEISENEEKFERGEGKHEGRRESANIMDILSKGKADIKIVEEDEEEKKMKRK
jgi:hypothetical protein